MTNAKGRRKNNFPFSHPVFGASSIGPRSRNGVSLLDLLVDGFEKNEVLDGFHWRDLPIAARGCSPTDCWAARAPEWLTGVREMAGY